MADRRAFTLIELSVVLAVIGLLVGGVIVGQNLMRAQALRNALQDAKTYAIAFQLFRDKYGSLPGDMPDAIRIWGNASGGPATGQCPANSMLVASVGNLTCNGDGNGVIQETENMKGENFRAWQHLVAAGMISGSYNGIHYASGLFAAVPGVNVPGSALDQSAFYIKSWGAQADNTNFYAGNYDNLIILGRRVTDQSTYAWPYGPLLNGPEAFEMDKKVDDGLPAYGTVRTMARTYMTSFTGNCTSSDTATAATYVLSEAKPACFLLFMSGFQAKGQ